MPSLKLSAICCKLENNRACQHAANCRLNTSIHNRNAVDLGGCVDLLAVEDWFPLLIGDRLAQLNFDGHDTFLLTLVLIFTLALSFLGSLPKPSYAPGRSFWRATGSKVAFYHIVLLTAGLGEDLKVILIDPHAEKLLEASFRLSRSAFQRVLEDDNNVSPFGILGAVDLLTHLHSNFSFGGLLWLRLLLWWWLWWWRWRHQCLYPASLSLLPWQRVSWRPQLCCGQTAFPEGGAPDGAMRQILD
mmetsp:Transcript_81530/g.149173  ORF Transcript_81530/g.149173 Transcript_81530/m.149173 type:complete len:245 (-) Transcript_81530:1528-2262(-)